MNRLNRSYTLSLVLLCVGALLSIAAYQTGIIDLGEWDEALYLQRAIRFDYFSADWGPVYSIYLRPFAKVFSDPIQIFYSSRLTLVFILLPLATFLFLRRLTGHAALAAACGLALSVLSIVTNVDPGIQLFNFVVWIFLGWEALKVFEKNWLIYPIAAVLGVMPYIRQDNVVWVALYFVTLSYFIFRNADRNLGPRPNTRILVSSMIGVVTFAYCWKVFRGSPFSNNRSLYAFLDHFFWNYPELFSEQSGIDRQQRVLAYFGHPESLSQLIIDNFGKLIPHFFNQTLLSARAFSNSLGNASIPFLIAIVFAVITNMWAWRTLSTAKQIFLIVIGLLFAKSLFLCVLLSPRDAYFIEFYLCLVGWVAIELHAHTQKRPKILQVAALILAIGFLIDRSDLIRQSVFPTRPVSSELISDRQYLQILRDKILAEHDPLLSETILGTGQTSMFLGGNIKNANLFLATLMKSHLPDRYSFRAFLDVNKYRLIVIDESFRKVARDSGIGADVENFEQTFSSFGYRRLIVSQRETNIYIRNLGMAMYENEVSFSELLQ